MPLSNNHTLHMHTSINRTLQWYANQASRQKRDKSIKAKNLQTQKQNIGDKLCRPTPWLFKRCYQLWRGTAAAYLFVFLFHLLIADGDRSPSFPLLSCTISWVAAMQLYEELLLDCKRWKDPFRLASCFQFRPSFIGYWMSVLWGWGEDLEREGESSISVNE